MGQRGGWARGDEFDYRGKERGFGPSPTASNHFKQFTVVRAALAAARPFTMRLKRPVVLRCLLGHSVQKVALDAAIHLAYILQNH